MRRSRLGPGFSVLYALSSAGSASFSSLRAGESGPRNCPIVYSAVAAGARRTPGWGSDRRGNLFTRGGGAGSLVGAGDGRDRRGVHGAVVRQQRQRPRPVAVERPVVERDLRQKLAAGRSAEARALQRQHRAVVQLGVQAHRGPALLGPAALAHPVEDVGFERSPAGALTVVEAAAEL